METITWLKRGSHGQQFLSAMARLVLLPNMKSPNNNNRGNHTDESATRPADSFHLLQPATLKHVCTSQWRQGLFICSYVHQLFLSQWSDLACSTGEERRGEKKVSTSVVDFTGTWYEQWFAFFGTKQNFGSKNRHVPVKQNLCCLSGLSSVSNTSMWSLPVLN